MKKKPTYAIESVDKALLLASILQHEGPQRVTDAAELVGVSVSTAHRLFAMLVYRDFAVQLPDRRYAAGPLLEPREASHAPLRALRRAGLPHLARLAASVHETANLAVRAGTQVRVVAGVESDQPVSIGDRTGFSLPAHQSAVGKVILAGLPADDVARLYAAREDVDLARLREVLDAVRTSGFAVNDEEVETGLAAIGLAVPDAEGRPFAGIALSMPASRFGREKVAGWVGQLRTTAAAIRQDLDAIGS